MKQRVPDRECCLGTMLFLRPGENNKGLITLPSPSSSKYSCWERQKDGCIWFWLLYKSQTNYILKNTTLCFSFLESHQML